MNESLMYKDIFVPLLEVSRNPESHPFVAALLKTVTSFDIVDDEGQLEMNIMVKYPVGLFLFICFVYFS